MGYWNEQYAANRRENRLRQRLARVQPGTRRRDMKDLAWAAGFLEGEGFFGTRTGLSGPTAGYSTAVIACVQNNPQPLVKLRDLFGGYIYHRPRDNEWGGIYDWRLNGTAAISVMMTLWSFLSELKRFDVRETIEGWKAYPHQFLKLT